MKLQMTKATGEQLFNQACHKQRRITEMSNAELRRLCWYLHISPSNGKVYFPKPDLIRAIKSTSEIIQDVERSYQEI